jgi:hypothetical protein
MNSKRVYHIMLIGLMLGGLLTVGGVVLANRQLQKSAAHLHALKLENRVIEDQQLSLVRAKQDIEQYSELQRIAQSIVPQDKDQARAVREITSFAQANNIAIANISFPSSELGQATPKAAAPTTDESAPPAAAPLTQVKPVPGIPGVFQLEIVVQSDDKQPISFNQMTGFLERLEQNRRTAHVSNISIRQPIAQDRSQLAFTLSVNVYIKP